MKLKLAIFFSLLSTSLFAIPHPLPIDQFKNLIYKYNMKTAQEIFSKDLQQMFKKVTDPHFNPHTSFFLLLVDSSNVSELRKHYIAASYLKKDDTTIDAGAFVGAYTFFYHHLTPFGHTFAFEANPTPFSILNERAIQGFYSRIYPIEKAVSDRAGQTIQMMVYPGTLNQSSTVEKTLMNQDRMPGRPLLINVLTESLDNLAFNSQFANALSLLKLIKIDTEGHETAILTGGFNLLQNLNPLIIFEYGFDQGVIEPRSIEILEKVGYTCYDINTLEIAKPGHTSLITDIIGIPAQEREDFEAKVLPLLRQL